MSRTLISLDNQAKGRVFPFGSTAASDQGLVTIYNGTAALTNVVLDVKGSQNIAGNLGLTGDLNIVGNINLTGVINETSVTNLAVSDINITLNKGGTTAAAANSGLFVEGTSAAVIAKLLWDGAKWVAGDGTNQYEVILGTGAQTLNSKTLNNVTFSGTINGLSTSSITEGTNLYYTDGRVIAAPLTGYVVGANAALAATDTVLGALQKLQGQLNNKQVSGSYQPLNTDLTAIGGIAATSGLLKKTSAGAWSLDTNTYVVANAAVTTATKTKITYDAKGLVTAGADATTTDIAEGTNLYYTSARFDSAFTAKTTSNLSEGTNLYYTNGRVIAAPLTGLSAGTNTSITATDTVLQAFAKVQAQLDTKSSTTSYFRAAVVTGTQDGSNKVFTIGSAVLTGSEQVFVNGTLLNPGAANEYVISSTTITLQAAMYAPDANAVIRVYGVY